jgi:hypothetical protein
MDRPELTEDGKTMAEEARDSTQMLGVTFLVELVVVGGLLCWWLFR